MQREESKLSIYSFEKIPLRPALPGLALRCAFLSRLMLRDSLLSPQPATCPRTAFLGPFRFQVMGRFLTGHSDKAAELRKDQTAFFDRRTSVRDRDVHAVTARPH
jgi:hypothetical protein